MKPNPLKTHRLYASASTPPPRCAYVSSRGGATPPGTHGPPWLLLAASAASAAASAAAAALAAAACCGWLSGTNLSFWRAAAGGCGVVRRVGLQHRAGSRWQQQGSTGKGHMAGDSRQSSGSVLPAAQQAAVEPCIIRGPAWDVLGACASHRYRHSVFESAAVSAVWSRHLCGQGLLATTHSRTHLRQGCRCQGGPPAYVNRWADCCAFPSALGTLRGAVAALQSPRPGLQQGLQQGVLLHCCWWGPGTSVAALLPRL